MKGRVRFRALLVTRDCRVPRGVRIGLSPQLLHRCRRRHRRRRPCPLASSGRGGAIRAGGGSHSVSIRPTIAASFDLPMTIDVPDGWRPLTAVPGS